MTFNQLKEQKGNFITYADLLSTDEWFRRRLPILQRDDHRCTNCGSTRTSRIRTQFGGFINGYWIYNPVWVEKPEFFQEMNEVEKAMGDTFVGMATKPEDFELVNLPGEETFVTSEQPIFLQVHHHYYVKGNLPWEYSDDALTTLCNNCHLNFHLHNPIVYKDERGTYIEEFIACSKCGGSGYIPQYHYVDHGVCWECNGMGGYNAIVRDILSRH